MPISPAVPFGGIAGLRFLDRTYDRQFEVFNRSPEIQREIDYFRENAGSIATLDQLMGDRRILSVVLGAFGLEDDVNKGAFIRKVIDEGTLDPSAFANRLVEPAYRELSEALGFGNFDGAGTLVLEGTRTNLLDRFTERQFESAVGDINVDMRLALNFRREAAVIAEGSASTRTKWLQLLGSPPLRQVIETTLNLPSEFAAIELDQQVDEISRRSESLFGITDPAQLSDPEVLGRVVDRFVSNSQIAQGVTNTSVRGAVALSLLQASSVGSIGSANLFASNF